MRKKLKSFLLMGLMILLSMTVLFPVESYAAETTVADGMYYVELKEVPSSKNMTSVSYNNFNVAPRAFLNVNGGTYTLVMRIYGYNYWNVVKVLSQEGWKNIETLKPGTDWKDYNGNEMSGYETLAAKSGDEATNKYWKTVDKGEIDKDKNMGLVSIQLDNLNDAFAIGGYAVTTYNNKEVNTLVAQGYQLNLNTLLSATGLLYYSLGFGDKPENLQLDYARAIPIATNIEYDNTKTQSGLFADEFVSDAEFSQKDEIITAKFKVSEKSAEEIESVQVLENTSIEDALGKTGNSVYFKAFLLGTRGGVYGENVYDSDNKEFTLKFSSNDTVNSLITGIDVKIVTKQNSKGYRAVMYLSDTGMRMTTLKDEKTNASYTTFEKYILGSTLNVKSGEDANEYAVSDIKNVADGDNWRAYSFYLTDADGNSFVPHKGGTVRVPIPKEWNLDNTYIGVYTSNSKSVTTDTDNWQNYMKIVDDGDERYVEYTVQLNEWVTDGSVVMCKILKESDLTTELSEDGTYNVTAKFVKAGAEGVLSMADGCLERDAIVTVKDGKKSIYMNFHPLELVPGTNAYSYMGAVWNKEASDTEYYDYETEENGTLIDNCGFDAITEFSCVKSVKVSLADDSISENSYKMKVVPPAMAGGSTYEKAMEDAIDVDLKLYNIKKVSDDSTVQIPTYQKSVLRKSIDKAERYNESSYSSDSRAALKAALEDGKEYYNTLAGKDAGTDSNISDTIKEKSDAIENAIKALVENPELEAARTALKQAIDAAKTVELGNKTVSAFNELVAAIDAAQATYERSNVTIEELNAQVTTLAAAVETFKNSPNASTLDPVGLEDGEYKVYADMKKVDKTTDSMSNNAIDHWINLKVENGNYTAILDFNGMTISGQFGYLMNLSYYEAGYTYTSTGDPTGKLTQATVLSTQKDAQGNDIIDNFNDAQNLYPDIVAFPLVDKGTQQYVPLQVYVPIMENITAGTGTQNVLMKIDWTSLKSADDDTQEEITLEDGLYTVSSDLRETGSEEKSTFNQYLDKVRLLVQDGTVKAYIDFKNVEDGDTEKYVTLICFDDGEGVKAEEGRLDRAVLTLPKNVELTNVHLEDSTGTKVDARLYLALRSAAAQSADKIKLKEFIASAQGILQDGKTYTDASVSTLREALERAEQVDADEVAIGSEISSAGLALKNAIDTMEEVLPVTVDKTELKALLEEAANISNEDGSYTQQSYKIFTEALENAKSVDADEEATQEEVDYQIKVLRAAMDGLVKETEQDKSDLKAAIAEAEKLDAERDSYTAESWSAFAAAYNAAVRVAELEHASAAEIDAHTKNLRAAMAALIKVSGSDGELADGTYEINAEIVNATDPSKLSMADGALSHSTDEDGNEVKDPLLLIVKDGQYSVRMKFVELSSKLGDEPFSGYLGELSYYPDYDKTDELPGEDEKLEAATVESEYDGYDEYNDPDFGSDQHMQGKKYPKQLSIPVAFNDTEIWLKVYVPVMENISEGGGTQQARLHLDWSSVKVVRSEDVDVSALEDQLQYASGLEQGEASDETWNALQQAVTAAKAAYENPSLTQEQIDAQVTLLQRAMAAVQAENDQKADKTQLQALLTKAQEELAKTDVYTVSSREALQVIATYAQTVYEDENADQNSVDAAAKALESAINGLTALSSIDTSALESEITKAEALVSKTDVYTADSLQTLQIAINNAKRVLADADMTQEQVDRQVTALQNAQKGLIEKTYADKSALQAKITEAEGYVAETSKYTASTIAALKTAISNAQTVYADGNASQAVVDNQVTLLTRAIANLEEIEEEIKQDTSELADGVYSIKGKMVKVDKSSASMSNEAINHYVKLTVKNGKYYLTLDFCGLKYAGKYGYLGWLKYYKSGYSTDKYGNPTGSLGSVTVDSIQKDSKGKTISDSYGSNYPNQVTFPMISEALTDGYVPLQVYVPVMESISAGTGTQPVYLKLTWSSLKKTTSDDDVFADNTSTDDTDDDDTSTSSLLNFKSTLKTSTLGTGLLNNSSLKNSNSSLKSSNSSLGSNTTSLKGSNASLKGNASLTGTGTELSSALENGELLSSLASAEEQSAGTVTAGQTKTTSDQTTGSKVPVVPIATSLVVMLAGILYKLKSRGLLKLR